MHLVGASLVWCAEADGRLAGDERRLVGNLGQFDCLGNRILIVTINSHGVPAGSGKTGWLIGIVGKRDRAVDRDVVVIPEHDQLVQLQMTGKRDGFLADAFHEAAVTGNHIGVMVDEAVAELCIEDTFGKCHADGIGDALSERAGRRLDTGGVTIFRMACGARTELTEILDLVDGDVFVARKIEQRIEQHRAVACGEHETVAIRPVRVLRVVREKTGIKRRRYIGCTHRQAGMARIGFLYRVHREEADRVGHLVLFVGIGHGLSRLSLGGVNGVAAMPFA